MVIINTYIGGWRYQIPAKLTKKILSTSPPPPARARPFLPELVLHTEMDSMMSWSTVKPPRAQRPLSPAPPPSPARSLHAFRFLVWLEKRIEDCEDLDERVGLKSLMDIIKQVK